MRFARRQLCEEALLFWLEANDYALLFQKMDQISHAQAIYDTYMSPKAKFKVNVADAKIKAVATALANKDVNNALFVSSQKEVGTFMEQDLFPRYETWAKHEGKRKESKAAGGELAKLLDEGRLGNRKAMREALVALIDIPHQQELLRDSARKLMLRKRWASTLTARSTLCSSTNRTGEKQRSGSGCAIWMQKPIGW